jgi:hypothetical protein
MMMMMMMMILRKQGRIGRDGDGAAGGGWRQRVASESIGVLIEP